MKVLLLNGSPRANGCTFTALSEVAMQLEKNGIETEIVQMGAGAIHGCIACGKCNELDKCVFDDVVNVVKEKMKTADGFIVGTPVYYASPNGSLLALLDRLFYCSDRDVFAYKPAAMVASARRAGTTASLDALSKYFTISQMPVVSSQYWNMVHGNTPDQVRQDKEGMQIMRTLGNNMAWLLKCIEAGKAAGVEPMVESPRVATNFIR